MNTGFPSFLRRRSTTATTKPTTERRRELAGGTALLALVTTTVATVPVTTATTTTRTTVITAHHATRRSMRALLLDVRSGHNLGGNVQPFTQVVKTLGRQGVVVVLPREPALDVAARLEGLHGFDHLKNRNDV